MESDWSSSKLLETKMIHKVSRKKNSPHPPEKYLNQIIHADTLQLLKDFPENCIDIVLTDPPYFLDKLDESWKHSRVASSNYQHTVKSLPAGMKFDPEKGRQFYDWYRNISAEILRILKPGGFFFSFSAPRLYHRMASAVDDSGFYIRECFLWLYTQNQMKAMSLNHFIDKMDLDKNVRESLKKRFQGWKTPQVKSCYEPIICAQKPYDRTFLNNMLEHEIGLLNTNVRVGLNMFPANVLTVDAVEEVLDKYFLIGKPGPAEKGKFNLHRTVKPLTLCEHLLKLTAFAESTIVLDPFVGSGTTALAAAKLGLNFIGIDSNKEYVELARRRLKELVKEN